MGPRSSSRSPAARPTGFCSASSSSSQRDIAVTPDELLGVLLRESTASRAILRELEVPLEELERHLRAT
jgi:hypothetical protein